MPFTWAFEDIKIHKKRQFHEEKSSGAIFGNRRVIDVFRNELAGSEDPPIDQPEGHDGGEEEVK